MQQDKNTHRSAISLSEWTFIGHFLSLQLYTHILQSQSHLDAIKRKKKKKKVSHEHFNTHAYKTAHSDTTPALSALETSEASISS